MNGFSFRVGCQWCRIGMAKGRPKGMALIGNCVNALGHWQRPRALHSSAQPAFGRVLIKAKIQIRSLKGKMTRNTNIAFVFVKNN